MNDTDPLLVFNMAEGQMALDRAREEVERIDQTLARSQRVTRAYRRWLRGPRCWWCGR